MARTLESGRKACKSGEVDSVVVFLHGYGADGADLLGLADPLSEHLPNTVFVAPNAPEKCIGNPMGYQWFPIPWIDGSSEEEARRGMDMAVEDFNAFLDALMVDEDVLPEQVVLEITDPSVWVSEVQTKRVGGQLVAVTELVPSTSGPFVLNRADIRLTVLGGGRGVDIQGCTGS